MATIEMSIKSLIREHMKLLKLLKSINLVFDDVLDSNISISQKKNINKLKKKIIQEYRDQSTELQNITHEQFKRVNLNNKSIVNI